MLLLERADGGNGDDPFHAQLLHGEDIGAEVQLGGQEPMAPAVAGQKSHLPSLQLAGDEDIRGIAKRRTYLNLVRIAQAGHRIEPAAADDSNFRLLQTRLRTRPYPVRVS